MPGTVLEAYPRSKGNSHDAALGASSHRVNGLKVYSSVSRSSAWHNVSDSSIPYSVQFPPCGYSTIWPFMHLVMNVWIVSSFELYTLCTVCVRIYDLIFLG